ncbi:helix-hairpin-helix domain-containing protein [Alicyclobacillus sacchari]|nr:ComEA family DNA-binding protein [Alicyclobacillus sacchari]
MDVRLRPVGRWWRLVAVVMVALVAAGVGVFFGHGTNSDTASSPGTQMYGTSATARGGVDNAAIGAGDEEPGTIEVDVHGDVRHPGVVQVLSTARVGDAIRAAGGFLHAADAATVNEAALLWDGEEIDVLSSATTNGSGQGPSLSQQQGSGALPSSTSMRIDVNTADAATLETLPGVGAKRASEIIAYRTAHGPFADLQSLGQVRGIGPKTLAKWRNLVSFGGGSPVGGAVSGP